VRWVAAAFVSLAWLAACGDNERPDCAGNPAECRAACGYGSGDAPDLTLRD
jgi:hypothetical protein